jgi:hypothetical protein
MKPDNKGLMPKELRTTLRQAAALEIGYLVLNHEYELAEPSTAALPAIGADSTADGLVAAARQIAEHRATKLARMRTLLQNGQRSEALELAAELCGLQEDGDEASNRTHSRKH